MLKTPSGLLLLAGLGVPAHNITIDDADIDDHSHECSEDDAYFVESLLEDPTPCPYKRFGFEDAETSDNAFDNADSSSSDDDEDDNDDFLASMGPSAHDFI